MGGGREWSTILSTLPTWLDARADLRTHACKHAGTTPPMHMHPRTHPRTHTHTRTHAHCRQRAARCGRRGAGCGHGWGGGRRGGPCARHAHNGACGGCAGEPRQQPLARCSVQHTPAQVRTAWLTGLHTLHPSMQGFLGAGGCGRAGRCFAAAGPMRAQRERACGRRAADTTFLRSRKL